MYSFTEGGNRSGKGNLPDLEKEQRLYSGRTSGQW